MNRNLQPLLWLAVVLLLVVELVAGSAPVNVPAALADVFHGTTSIGSIILQEVRLPRALLALLTGAALGISGAALQGLLRNPLASPDLLGISQVSALLAVAVIYFGGVQWRWWALPAAALVGAALAVLILLQLTRKLAGTHSLILAGLALTALAGSLTTLALTFAPNPYALQEAWYWLLGSVANRSMGEVWLALPFVVIGSGLLVYCAPMLDALSLGESTAAALGFPLARYRWPLVMGVACNVGAAVAVSGCIGFVGLLVPHVLRSSCGAEPARLLRASAVGGATLVLLADVLVQQLPSAQELQLGVITALLGGPFFLLLLLQQRGER